MKSCFFGIELKPNNIYKTNVDTRLFLTRATLDPEATIEQNARLFMSIEKNQGPICHLNYNHSSVELSININPGCQLILRVAGDCSIHLTGYADPIKHKKDSNKIIDECNYYSEDEYDELEDIAIGDVFNEDEIERYNEVESLYKVLAKEIFESSTSKKKCVNIYDDISQTLAKI